ncbi:MAG TPA: phage tail tube protein [Thermaerobacter sp.]
MPEGLNGSAVLVLVQTGTDPTSGQPIFEAVAKQTNFSDETSRELIDDSAKGDDHVSHLYGRAETSAELEAAWVPNDAAFQALRQAYLNKEDVILRRTENGTDVEEARAKIENISREFPDNDRSTVTISFQLQEHWRQVTP